MAMVHEGGMAASLRKRVQSLRPDSNRKWGKMTVDQMLFHVNLILAEALGEYSGARSIRGVPQGLLLWLVLTIPWGKGAPTRPDMVVTERHDFAKEQKRCLEMIDRVAALPLSGTWPASANFGAMSGTNWSRLLSKHTDHHLRQFGV